MKTILEWLNEAKHQGHEWADAAIRNHDPNFFKKKNVLSLSDALLHAFNWDVAPEKDGYWESVFDSIEMTPDLTILELANMYEDSKVSLNALKPDYEVKEPYRTQILEAYKSFYEDKIENIQKQIIDKIGLSNINDAVSRLAKALESKERELSAIDGVYSDKINRIEKEFNDYKVKSEEELGKYKNEYNNHVLKIDQLEQQLLCLKSAQCSDERKVVGWITQDNYCRVLRHKTKPRKVGLVWVSDDNAYTITIEDALSLCGRLPVYVDKEPVPIYE